MKRNILIAEVEDSGYWLKRHGAEHDIYTNGTKSIPIPRHREINEMTAKAILKKVGK